MVSQKLGRSRHHINEKVAFCCSNAIMTTDRSVGIKLRKYMNHIILFCIVFAMISGILQGLNDMGQVRQNPSLGVKESKNLFTFLFTDKY